MMSRPMTINICGQDMKFYTFNALVQINTIEILGPVSAKYLASSFHFGSGSLCFYSSSAY